MRGMYLEEFEPGAVISHTLRRTVTEMDNMLFSNMTLNPQPLHIDFEFCKTTEFGQPLVNSLFTLGLMIGISVNDTTVGTTIANLGMSEVTFPHPLFHGDTVRVETKVLSVRESTLQARSGHRRVRASGLQSARQARRALRRQAMMRKRPQS
jgi:acyl dehydratase